MKVEHNEEKVLGKTNWRDTTILKIISNEIYKGDYVSGKRSGNSVYYENVVEPLVSKELWENCQVQKKKNSRNYMRTQTYLFLQKLKCPKCGRILAGGATHKVKNNKWYFYYRCEDCKREMIIDFNAIKTSVPVRYSEFTSIKDIMQNFYRLNECYEVNLYKGTFYKDTEKLDIGPILKDEVPVRIFPLQKNNNGDNNWLSMGMLATKNNPNDIKVNIRDIFETIPDNVTEEGF